MITTVLKLRGCYAKGQFPGIYIIIRRLFVNFVVIPASLTLQMPFVIVSEGFGSPSYRHKIRMRPDIAPALKAVLTDPQLTGWTKAYYFYSTKDGKRYP